MEQIIETLKTDKRARAKFAAEIRKAKAIECTNRLADCSLPINRVLEKSGLASPRISIASRSRSISSTFEGFSPKVRRKSESKSRNGSVEITASELELLRYYRRAGSSSHMHTRVQYRRNSSSMRWPR